MDMFQKQISDMKLLSQKNAAAYYQYSVQAATEGGQGRLPRFPADWGIGEQEEDVFLYEAISCSDLL